MKTIINFNFSHLFIMFPYSKLDKNVLWIAKIWDRVILGLQIRRQMYRLCDLSLLSIRNDEWVKWNSVPFICGTQVMHLL